MGRKPTVPSQDPITNGADAFPFGANVETSDHDDRDAAGPAPAARSVNPFSREALRLNQNYAAALGLEKHIHNLPVDKPPSESWFRVHPDINERGEEMFFDTYLLHIKNGSDRGV